MAKGVKKNSARDNMVSVYIDRAADGGEGFVRVGVNGRMYQVPRGRNVQVPRPVYEVIRRSTTARAVTEAFMKDNVWTGE